MLPVANFGKVNFTDANATAGRHTGGISDSHWSATRIQLKREPLDLDSGVREAVDRARRRAPQVAFDLELEPTVIEAAPTP